MDPQATCGRMVHYHMAGGQKRAAIVNADTPPDGTACLTVQLDTGPSVVFAVPYSEEPAVGCWSWMPFQHAKAKTERGNESESAEPADRFPPLGKPVGLGGADPVGEPASGLDEPVASGPTKETAVVDGAEAVADQGEPLEPEKTKKSKKK